MSELLSFEKLFFCFLGWVEKWLDREKILKIFLEEENKARAERNKAAEREAKARIKYYDFH